MRRIAIILAAAAACALASAGDSCRSRDTAEPAERGLPHQLPGHNPVPGHITHGRRADPAAGPGADMGDDAGLGFRAARGHAELPRRARHC